MIATERPHSAPERQAPGRSRTTRKTAADKRVTAMSADAGRHGGRPSAARKTDGPNHGRGMARAGTAGEPLGKYEDKAYSSPEELTWRMRVMGWRTSSLRSVRACGRSVLPPSDHADGNAHVKTYIRSDGSIGVSIGGLCSCGSRNCARCAGVIARQRALQLADGLDWWLNAPYTNADGRTSRRCALFLTLTVRHSLDDTPADLIDAVSHARSALTNGTPYRGGRRFIGDRDRHGIAGWVNTIENTWNPVNGHHIHLHAIVLLARIPTVEEYVRLGRRLFGRWAASLVKDGFDCDMNHGGFSLRLVSDTATAGEALAEYVCKDTAEHAAFELLNGQGKHGRNGSMTYFGMLAQIANDPKASRFWFALPKGGKAIWPDANTLMVADALTGEIIGDYPVNNPTLRLLRITHETEQALKGRRMVTYSHRAKDAVNPLDTAWNKFLDKARPDDQTDEQLADNRADLGSDVMEIRPGQWYEQYVTHPERIFELLDNTRRQADL